MSKIKNNEQLLDFACETLHRYDTGEISRDDAKVRFFGVAVIQKCFEHRAKLARLTGKTIEEIVEEGKSASEGKIFKRTFEI